MSVGVGGKRGRRLPGPEENPSLPEAPASVPAEVWNILGVVLQRSDLDLRGLDEINRSLGSTGVGGDSGVGAACWICSAGGNSRRPPAPLRGRDRTGPPLEKEPRHLTDPDSPSNYAPCFHPSSRQTGPASSPARPGSPLNAAAPPPPPPGSL